MVYCRKKFWQGKLLSNLSKKVLGVAVPEKIHVQTMWQTRYKHNYAKQWNYTATLNWPLTGNAETEKKMNLAIFHVSRVFSLFTPAWTPTRLTSNSNEFVNVKSHAQTEVTNYGSQDTAEDKMNHVILSNVARFNESSHI